MRPCWLLIAAVALGTTACEFQGGDPVQHALRDAAAARQAAALKTSEEQQAATVRRAAARVDEAVELSGLIAARRKAVNETRALIAATADPALKAQLTGDLRAEEARLKALEARLATTR